MSIYQLLDNSLDTIKNINNATTVLEHGEVIFLPNYSLQQIPTDTQFLVNNWLNHKSKNISYQRATQKLSGYNTELNDRQIIDLQDFMARYASFASDLLQALCPSYIPHINLGRTSFRPAEINGRKTSKRKDDTRLHVDSFAATPVNGKRILRVFCNINPHNLPRVWHIGEPFSRVLDKFLPTFTPYSPMKAKLLKTLKITKSTRSVYDHYMLQLHDNMKLDDTYQATVCKQRIEFTPYSTWIVFTDQVSHAALSGKYLLEQTFYLDVNGMENKNLAPIVALQDIV